MKILIAKRIEPNIMSIKYAELDSLRTLGDKICKLLLNKCNFSNIVKCSRTSGSSSKSLFPQLRICNCNISFKKLIRNCYKEK